MIVFVETKLAANTRVIDSGSIGNIEYLIIRINALNMILVTIYRPPTAQTTDFSEVIGKVRRCLDSLSDPMPNISFTGDLNFTNFDWANQTFDGGTQAQKTQCILLLEPFDDFFI